MQRFSIIIICSLFLFTSCSRGPTPGPDKRFSGGVSGAIVGAGTGAVAGAELTAAAGPGAWVGAGFGALYGMVKGAALDVSEEEQMRHAEEERVAREYAWAQEVLAEQYAKRLELHPSRDIYPADLFFEGDSDKIGGQSLIIVKHLAEMTKRRMPWSRIAIASYITAKKDSRYAKDLSRRRAEEIANHFVSAGVDPRRIQTRALVLNQPVLLDPADSFDRYRQAIEIIPVDY